MEVNPRHGQRDESKSSSAQVNRSRMACSVPFGGAFLVGGSKYGAGSVTISRFYTKSATIHPCSCARWKIIYLRNCEMVCDLATYDLCGQPPKLNKEEPEFLSILELEDATGRKIVSSTIHTTIGTQWGQTRKTAQTVHPENCPINQAQYTIDISLFPANFQVFTGE
ncbi:hypothetical protein VP01_1324g3 [Puccinia sorghi]|uniref:Uncharacterized protein n=1 Tax=Puccinia sorghi TaxID=27349 RepID=A0A0L6VML7_9BASI|nr:hypothetical protein VP01_1324g3 [Puccinia sorghi]